MIRVFSIKAYWSDTRRLRKEYIVATDKEDALKKVEQMGGYRVRAMYEDFNHLPNKNQLAKAKKYNINPTDFTKKELREIIKKYEGK